MTVNLSALAGAGQQFFDNNGNPLSGGKLWSYEAGTTTPQPTYTTAAGNVAHTNPIILDSAGRVPSGEIWLTAGQNYKFVLMTSVNVTLVTWDNITGISGTGIATDASLVAYTPAGVGAVTTTVQTKLRQLISVKDYGAVCDGVANDATALFNANAAAVSAKVPLLIIGTMYIGSSVTVTATIVDSLNQFFTTDSQVTIDNGLPVRPEWWGDTAAAGKYAVNALPATGGVVKFANKRYDSPYSGPFGSPSYLGDTWLDKPNVRFSGEKMPEFKSDNTGLADGSGTIINGVLNVWAENFQIENLGIDSGTTQRARLGLAKTQDGLVLAPPTQSLGYFRRKGSIQNIVSIGVLANDFGHNILFEGYQAGTIENCEARFAIHGIVIKSSGINGNNLTALGNSADNFIIKSDNYGVQVGCNFTNLYAKPFAGNTPLYGIYVLAASAGGGNVNISNAEITSGATSGVRIESSASSVLYTTNLSNIIVDGSEHGIYSFGPTQAWYLNVNNASIKNATIGVVEQGNVRINNYSNINFVNVDTGFDTVGDPMINNVWCSTMTTFMQYNGDAKPTIGLFEYLAGTLTNYDNLATPAFLNGWTNFGGSNPSFDVFMRNGQVSLAGFIAPGPGTAGTSSKICNLPVNLRPPVPLYFSAPSSTGAAFVVVEAGGDVYVSTPAAALWVALQNVSYVVH